MGNSSYPSVELRGEIEKLIADSNSIRGALFAVKNSVSLFGNCNLAYELLVRQRGYIRGDLVNMTTLSHEVTSLYYPSGGTNTDPIIDKVGREEPFLEVDISGAIDDPESKYFGNPFFGALREGGCVSLAAYCVSEPGTIGHAAFTVFEDASQQKRRHLTGEMLAFASAFHHALRCSGLIGRFFEINEREIVCLDQAAAGRSASDMANAVNVTGRTIELRLQSARKKLRARNTTEAVYKAVAYGMLPLSAGSE